ncbi:hypothetical protein HJG60_008002 [Phyllostomus discolor]|uniref:Uncharacterized protein n=1 Tax=Phyllostomus discolor TaxID=89673 RepID=A0A834BJY2_9CHIR|nr:hypothetical protein HJG60_008002 [Phyllostomus discolor]
MRTKTSPLTPKFQGAKEYPLLVERSLLLSASSPPSTGLQSSFRNAHDVTVRECRSHCREKGTGSQTLLNWTETWKPVSHRLSRTQPLRRVSKPAPPIFLRKGLAVGVTSRYVPHPSPANQSTATNCSPLNCDEKGSVYPGKLPNSHTHSYLLHDWPIGVRIPETKRRQRHVECVS